MVLESEIQSLGGLKPASGTEYVPLSDAEISQIEVVYETGLPTVYRQFLAQYGACVLRRRVLVTPITPLPPALLLVRQGLLRHDPRQSHRGPANVCPLQSNTDVSTTDANQLDADRE